MKIFFRIFGFVCIMLGLVPICYIYCEDVADVLVHVFRGDIVSYRDAVLGLPLVIFGILLNRGVIE